MARTKRSPALFEVIHSGRRTDKSTRQGILRTPKWWFKGRAKSDSDAAAAPVKAENSATTIGAAREGTSAPPRSAAPAPSPAPVPVSYSSTYANFAARSGIQCALDNDRQEVNIRIRYTSAIIAGFALIVLLSLAYLTGRHSGGGASLASASPTTDELRSGPAQPGVLDVAPPAPDNSAVQPPPAEPVGQAEDRAVAPDRAPESTILDTNPRRVIGLNYVIVQSYPEEQLASQACEFLRGNGVKCTVEKGPAGWTPNWYSVVGIVGFKGGFSSSPEYNDYVQQIERLGEEFAGRSSFKRFEPRAYRWKEQS